MAESRTDRAKNSSPLGCRTKCLLDTLDDVTPFVPFCERLVFRTNYHKCGGDLHLLMALRSLIPTVCQFSLFVFSPDSCSLGAETTQKRFWKDVGIERRAEGLVVTLDKRPLKTPAGQTLLLPAHKSLAATLIAAEWDHQETLLKPHALPMVTKKQHRLLQHIISYSISRRLLFQGPLTQCWMRIRVLRSENHF